MHACTNTQAHACTNTRAHTHKHSDCTKLNLHSLKLVKSLKREKKQESSNGHMRFSDCQRVQPVHHIWRHIPAQPQQLWWAVLRDHPHASVLWQPLLYGWVTPSRMFLTVCKVHRWHCSPQVKSKCHWAGSFEMCLMFSFWTLLQFITLINVGHHLFWREIDLGRSKNWKIKYTGDISMKSVCIQSLFL